VNYLAQFFIKNYKFTLILTVMVLIFGFTGTMSLKSESFPSVEIGAVVITTRYDGATAEDIETKITKPIEEEIQKVAGIKLVKSTSQAGFSTIVTEVDIDKYSVADVIGDLQRAVDRTSGLPEDLKERPLFTEIKSDEFPVIEVAIVGSNENRQRDMISDQVREDLKDNKKVSSISQFGFADRQFNVFLDFQKLSQNHVSVQEVQQALAMRNITVPAGEIKGDKLQKLIRIDGKARSPEEIRQIVIRSNFSGQKITVGDVARIEDGAEDVKTLALHNGEPATLLVVTKKAGADLIELAAEVESVLESYRKKHEGKFQFYVFSDEGKRVGDRLSVLFNNGWQGIILVVIVLLFLMPGKVGLVTALSLPLAIAATMGFINMMGFSLNTITIIALMIAIGMLVDNAVVISENYTRLRDEGFEVDEAILKTIRDLYPPVVATALATVAAFMPMLVTTGVMGQFIKAIPIVVTASLLLSLAESFFLLPTRLKMVGYKPVRNREMADKDYLDRVIVPKFEKVMTWVVDNKYKTFLIFNVVLVATFLMLAFVNKLNLFPSNQTEIYIGRLEAPRGTRVEETEKRVKGYTGKLKKEVEKESLHIVAVVGESATDPSDPKGAVGSNLAMIRVFVNRETQDKADTNEILTRLRSVKSADFDRISYEALINGPPVGDPVTVTFRSNNAEELDKVVNHLVKHLAEQPGIFDAKIDDVRGEDEVLLKFDYAQLARLGLNLDQVGGSVRMAIAGMDIGDINLDNREVDYFIRLEDSDKASLGSLGKIQIPDRQGNLISLSQIAQFQSDSGPPQIKRYDGKRARTITANIDDNVITSIQANAILLAEFEKINKDYKTVSVVFGGEAEKTNESFQSLLNALVLSLFGIFALMVLVFRSFTSPFIIMTTVPLGLIGVAISFFFHRMDLSFMALIGVIGLGGVIVNSGIILITFIEQMRKETALSLREILIKASAMRLRAVLATSVTNIVGLIPTAYGIGGVDYFIIPMAMALAWGLTTGTLFTLIWVPPAFGIIEELKEKLKLRWRKQ
jgi:multidrug efflux pump subunit AcrB